MKKAVAAFRREYERLSEVRRKSPLFRQVVVDRIKRKAHRKLWSEMPPVDAFKADLVYAAAASDRGPETSLVFESIEGTTLTVKPERAIKCLSNVLDPVAKNGQLLLLGSWSCNEGDMVACRTQGGEHWLGRMSRVNGVLAIAPVNPVKPRKTLCIPETAVEILLPVIGILYEGAGARIKCQLETSCEWGCVPGNALTLSEDIVAVRAEGNCMDPVVRHSQWLLVRECAIAGLADCDLCIVEKNEGELFFKRFHKVTADKIVLTSTNPVVPESPMLMDRTAVSRAFRLLLRLA